jgi:hypothetical protein
MNATDVIPSQSSATDWSVWVPIVISIIALFIGVFNYWWLHWRKGHITIAPPLSYRIAKIGDNGLIVELPLGFFNTGVTPILVNNIYLVITFNNNRIPMYINATRNNIEDSAQKAPKQFIVDGGKHLLDVFSFQIRDKPITIDIGKWDCEVFCKLDSGKYRSVSKFYLYVKYLDESLIPRLNFDDEYRKLVDKP